MKQKLTIILLSLLLSGSQVFSQAPMSVYGIVNNTGDFYSPGRIIIESDESSGIGSVINSGSLVLQGGLILKSDDTSDGLLVNHSAVNLEGLSSPGDIELRKTFGESRYYYLCFPFPVSMSQICFASSGSPLVYGTDYYMREYDAAKRAMTGNPDEWKRLDAGTTLSPGKGYLFALDSDVSEREIIFPASDVSTLFSIADQTVDLSYETLDVPDPWHYATTQKSFGWNFVGSLSTGNFDMSQSGSSYSGTVYCYDKAENRYRVFKMSLGDNAVIPPYVPFFTHEGESGKSVVYSNQGVSSNSTYFTSTDTLITASNLRSQGDSYDIIALSLKGDRYSDLVRIVSGDGFTESLDYNNDASKMFDPNESIPQLWASKGDDELCITMLPVVSSRTVPLGVTLNNGGTYSFGMNRNYSGIYESIILVDKETSSRTDLLSGEYRFTVPSLLKSGRFELELNKTPTSAREAQSDNNVIIYIENQHLHVKNINQGDRIQVYDVAGRLLISSISDNTDFTTQLSESQGALLVKVTGSVNKAAKVINR